MSVWVLVALIIGGTIVLVAGVVFLFLAYAVRKGMESDGTVYDDMDNRVGMLEADMGRVLEKLEMKSVTEEEGEVGSMNDERGTMKDEG